MIVRISSLERILSIRAFWTLRILPRSGRIAWKPRSRPCFAEPPAESPSTRYTSQIVGSSSEQSASLPGSSPPSRPLLLRTSSRALRAASRARGVDRLTDHRPGHARVLVEKLGEGLVHDALDDPFDLRIAELRLGMPL